MASEGTHSNQTEWRALPQAALPPAMAPDAAHRAGVPGSAALPHENQHHSASFALAATLQQLSLIHI